MDAIPALAYLSPPPDIIFHPLSFSVAVAIGVMAFLLIFSALVSGSEVAFFSLSPVEIKQLKKAQGYSQKNMLLLLKKPEKLLATILIANNFINVSIVVLSSYVTQSLVDFSASPLFGFLFQVVVVTFLLLLFGEIIPKVLASYFAFRFAQKMVLPFVFLNRIFSPLSYFLVHSTSFVNKKFSKKAKNLSVNELSNAFDITEKELMEREILKSIVNFGLHDVKEIMIPRVDVFDIDIKTQFTELLSVLKKTSFSRIPVYSETSDNVLGVLYVKDMLPYLQENDDFDWKQHLREPYFVPESKKVRNLLDEFQTQRIHLAIVIDEYGGTAGIVSLEDILEEIVGEITDESDEKKENFLKIDDKNYIFEGKTLLNDFYKILKLDDTIFDDKKGDADTLAGLILEIKGEFPQKGDVTDFQKFTLKVEAVSKRRIQKIKFTFKD